MVMFSIPRVQVRTGRPQGGGGGVGPMRTKADKGEGGSILADILRTSFMDDPLELCLRTCGTRSVLWTVADRG